MPGKGRYADGHGDVHLLLPGFMGCRCHRMAQAFCGDHRILHTRAVKQRNKVLATLTPHHTAAAALRRQRLRHTRAARRLRHHDHAGR